MQMYIEVDKQKIYLNHYPFLCYGGAYRNMWQLFGHVHTSKNNTGKRHFTAGYALSDAI
ncbi:hypothetical protein HMPREF9441_03444 [Paraprevotella clara YIT 11840]|uniref:Uncharacterized protein n=1 Tax=Paraprevotella clara YIT 11840 TaxID=762968 RepID=G5SVM7_9BACT|nr:hypothetical protein HMPREF9441_03444 [Paraprevotella clara YIT 11840]